MIGWKSKGKHEAKRKAPGKTEKIRKREKHSC
jgi:hypothetical protein